MSVPPTIHVRWVEPATVVDAIGPKVVSTDGPFADTQVHLGGFWITRPPTLDEAFRWALEASKACAGPVEVRPIGDEPEE